MKRNVRRIVVAHLASRSMTAAQIADELGVSRDTVRRDLDAVVGNPTADEPEAAAPPAPGLLLPESTQLSQDLNVLTAAFKAQPEDAAQFAIHQLARQVRARWQARIDARERQQA